MQVESITLDELRDVVRGIIKTHGYRGAGRRLGIAPSYVHALANDDDSLPGEKVLAALGYVPDVLRFVKAVPVRPKKRRVA